MDLRRLCLVAAAVLMSASAPAAYVLLGQKWAVQQVPYYINPVNSDMPEADAIADIQSAAMAWATQSNANILPYYMGRTSGSSITRNGANEVFFRPTANGSVAAETYRWSDGYGHTIETDIVIYDGGFTFYNVNSTCSGGVYLLDIATHEFGHALGIAHSNLSGATMTSGTGYCWSTKRWLADDDKQAIEALYPPASTNTTPVVAVSSPSSSASVSDGTAVNFVASATDKEDGDLSSAIVWTSSLDGQLGVGPNLQRILSVGNHAITARATDSTGATADVIRNVSVTAAPATSSGLTLTGQGYKTKGSQRVDLSWSGANSEYVDVYRDGNRLTIVANSGAFTDRLNKKGGGVYSYVVCESSTSTCSNAIRISF
jgi:hypothetical protein